MHNYDMKWKF